MNFVIILSHNPIFMPKTIVVGSISTDMAIRTPQIPIPDQTVIGNTFT
jgi:hypothetical protein